MITIILTIRRFKKLDFKIKNLRQCLDHLYVSAVHGVHVTCLSAEVQRARLPFERHHLGHDNGTRLKWSAIIIRQCVLKEHRVFMRSKPKTMDEQKNLQNGSLHIWDFVEERGGWVGEATIPPDTVQPHTSAPVQLVHVHVPLTGPAILKPQEKGLHFMSCWAILV